VIHKEGCDETFWHSLQNQLKTPLCFERGKERKTKSEEEGEREEEIKEENFGVMKLGFKNKRKDQNKRNIVANFPTNNSRSHTYLLG